MTVTVEGVTLARRGRTILADLSFTLAPGSITLVAGPNGVGKSTLLAALAGDLVPTTGCICLAGMPLFRMPLAERARRRAMLPQRPAVAFGFPVEALVAMGLHPHGLIAARDPGRRIVRQAVAALDLEHLADRPAVALSGGEEQRAHLARMLAQVEGALCAGHRPLLLLDEPTTGLDYRHQFALARTLRGLAERGVTIALSLHDLALGRRLADRVLLLGDGRLRAAGPPDAALAPGLVTRWFGLEAAEARRLVA